MANRNDFHSAVWFLKLLEAALKLEGLLRREIIDSIAPVFFSNEQCLTFIIEWKGIHMH